MSKPYTEDDLSNMFYSELSWRRKEISDLKLAIKLADAHSKTALLKSLVAICYSHWEGYIKFSATKYFEHLALRRRPYIQFERQIYVNSVLLKLDALRNGRKSVKERCALANEILDGQVSRFAYINPALIDTGSNLNTDTISDICTICGISSAHFESKRSFIDILLLKRRNAIAHGQQENIQESDMDGFASEVLALMEHFKALLENKVYRKEYVA